MRRCFLLRSTLGVYIDVVQSEIVSLLSLVQSSEPVKLLIETEGVTIFTTFSLALNQNVESTRCVCLG